MSIRNPTCMTYSQPIPGFTDAEMYDQIDVSDENSRTYVFGPGRAYRIDLPLIVAVKKGKGGHSHRVIDAAGTCHYIPKGWIAIYWDLQENTAIPLPSPEPEGLIDIDDLATGIFQAIDDLPDPDEVPTSREVEEQMARDGGGTAPV